MPTFSAWLDSRQYRIIVSKTLYKIAVTNLQTLVQCHWWCRLSSNVLDVDTSLWLIWPVKKQEQLLTSFKFSLHSRPFQNPAINLFAIVYLKQSTLSNQTKLTSWSHVYLPSYSSATGISLELKNATLYGGQIDRNTCSAATRTEVGWFWISNCAVQVSRNLSFNSNSHLTSFTIP
jgi:hypothetical protein